MGRISGSGPFHADDSRDGVHGCRGEALGLTPIRVIDMSGPRIGAAEIPAWFVKRWDDEDMADRSWSEQRALLLELFTECDARPLRRASFKTAWDES